MTSVPAQAPLRTLIFPSAPTGTMTELATVWPAVKFRLEVDGAACPLGKTVRWPASFGLVTVTLSATAIAPAGMPLLPVIWTPKAPCPAT